MTPSESMLTQGFLENLDTRGVFVSIGANFWQALFESQPKDTQHVSLEREIAVGDRIHILRSHLLSVPGMQIGIGSVFTDPYNRNFRVIEVEDDPASVAVVFTCEVRNA